MVIGLLFCSLAFNGGCIGLYSLSRYFSAFLMDIHLLIKKKNNYFFHCWPGENCDEMLFKSRGGPYYLD